MAFRLSAMPWRLSKRRTTCMGPEAADVVIKVGLSRHITAVQQCQGDSLACLLFSTKRSMSMHIYLIIMFSAAGRSKRAVCRHRVDAQASPPRTAWRGVAVVGVGQDQEEMLGGSILACMRY